MNSILLSPLDQFMPRTYTRVFLVFAVGDHDLAIQAFREGLRKTYLQLPYLKGSVYTYPEEGNKLAIAWTNDGPGPELQEIRAPADMPSFSSLKSERAPIHYFQKHLCPVDVKPDHSSDKSEAAVFAASYSRLEGGLIVSISVHHTVMDGTGVGELLTVLAHNTKSDIYSPDLHLDSAEPLTRLSRILESVSASAATGTFSKDDLIQRHPEFTFPSASASTPKSGGASQAPKGTSKIFTFPSSRLAAAKELLGNFTKPEFLTANNILSALAWSCITRIRLLRLSPQESKLGFAVNGRKHLGKEFIDTPYLGNVNLFGLARLQASDLDAASKCRYSRREQSSAIENAEKLVPVVSAISAAISKISQAHIAEVVSLVEATPNALDVAPGWNSWNATDLTLTSWANLGVHECDFGGAMGRPEFVRVPFAEFDGLAVVLPRRRQKDDEVIELVVMLRGDDMEALERDEVWRSWTL